LTHPDAQFLNPTRRGSGFHKTFTHIKQFRERIAPLIAAAAASSTALYGIGLRFGGLAILAFQFPLGPRQSIGAAFVLNGNGCDRCAASSLVDLVRRDGRHADSSGNGRFLL
jgi:hypothetical protein